MNPIIIKVGGALLDSVTGKQRLFATLKQLQQQQYHLVP